MWKKQIEYNRVLNVDCLDYMRSLPDKSFDLVLTDPPYGINMCVCGTVGTSNLAKVKDYGPVTWDQKRPTKEVFTEILRVSKNQIFFGGNYFIDYLIPGTCWVVWDKKNGENRFADFELVYTSFVGGNRIFRYRWAGMLQEGNSRFKEFRVHPTQKPVSFAFWLLNKFCLSGQTVFDPFAGSGTFLFASQCLGHPFVGCETDHKYVNIIKDRLKQTTL